MKIKAIILAITILLGIIAVSCGASKTCPAYGKVTTEQPEESHS
jgi:hypothetical protein